MTRLRLLRLTSRVTAVLLLAGCANAHFSAGGQLDPRGEALRPPLGEAPGQPRSPTQSGGIEYRQICRSEKAPTGWVVTDYSSAAEKCAPQSSDEPGANLATILRYTSLPVETLLMVCADRPVPRGWVREPTAVEPAATGRCPRKPGDLATGPTVMEIRRIR